MKKTMKKLLSFLLSISIIMSTLSMVVLAEDGETPPKFEVKVSSVLEDGSTTAVIGQVDADYRATLTIPNAAVNAGNVTVTVTMNDVDSLDVPGSKSHSVTLHTGVNAEGNLFDALNGLGYRGLQDFQYAHINADINGKTVVYTLNGEWDNGKTITGEPSSVEDARTAWHAMVNDANIVVTEQETDNSYLTVANGSWLQIGSEALVFETEGNLTVDPSADGNTVDNIRGAVKVIETEDSALAFVLKAGTALAVGGSVATLKQDVKATVDVDADGLTVLSDLRDAVADFNATAMIKSLLGWMDTAIRLVDCKEINVTAESGTFNQQPVEKAEEPPIGAYNLRDSIAKKLENAKFVGVVASTNVDGTTTEVVGTVDADYNAKLRIPNANVNANSLWLGVGMNGVESLGGGQRIHALPEKHLMGDSGSGSNLNIFDTLHNYGGFDALKDFGGAVVKATIVPVTGDSAAVTYTLAGTWNDKAGKTITGTPESADAARTAWHTMVNKTNFDTPANVGDDSHIVIKSGSWLQIGDQRLQFTPGKGDITLFTADGDDVASICDKVELATGEEGMTLAFLLKEGTTLAVGGSSAVLKNDVVVNVEGIAADALNIDGENALIALRKAVNSGETPDMVGLLIQLAGLMDTAVAAVDGGNINAEIRFICNHAYGEPVWAEDHTTVTRTCDKCGDVQTADAQITSVVTTEPTYETAGVRTYTATATFEGETEAIAATWTEEISKLTPPYNLRTSIAEKLDTAKFVGIVASTNLDGTTTEVVGTVDADYNAKLRIPNANVNANSLWLGVGMNGVESLGGGQRIHALPEKHLMGDSGSGSNLNIFDTLHNYGGFDALKDFGGAVVKATIVPVTGDSAAVTYTLAGTWNDKAGKTITGTPESADAARTAWHTMVNKTNFDTPANVGDDSHIVIKSGSWLQIGDQRLQFTPGKGDITLFTADGDDVASICDKVELATGEEGMTLAFLLKEGTTLAVGGSSAVLKNDVVVNVEGIAADALNIDGENALIALRKAVNSGETPDMVGLLIQLAGLMDTAVAAVDGGNINAEIRFICNHTLTKTDAKAATCTEAGNIAYWTCEKCGKLFSDEAGTTEIALENTVTAATGHTYGEPVWTWTQAANGEWTAAAAFTCGKCNDVQTPNVTVTKKVTDATCIANGVIVYTATTNFKDTEYTATKEVVMTAEGHKHGATVRENVVAATCTTEGSYDEVVYCTVCNAEISREKKTIPMIAHTLTATAAKDATCTASGNIAYWTCSVCWKKFSDAEGTTEVTNTVIPANGHSLTSIAAKAATCTEIGWHAYQKCSHCDYTTYREIPALGHSFGAPEFHWTGNDQEGWTATASFTCSACHEATTIVDAAISVADGTAPDCTQTGTRIYTATARRTPEGDSYTDTHEVTVPALGHRLVSHEAHAATCTEAGNIAYWTCESCGKLFSDEAGTTEITLEATVIDAISHSLTATAAKAATCTEAGNIAYWTCGVCGKLFSDEAGTTEITLENTVTAATGHTYGEPVWTEDHTMVTRTCTACNAAQTATAVITSEVTTEATYSAAGVRTYTATATFEGETEAVTAAWTEEIPRLRRSGGSGGGGGNRIDRPNNTVTVTDPVVNPPEVIIPDDKPPLSDLPISTIFTDVADDAWYADAVRFVSDNKLMIGVGDGSGFAPTLDTTRSMIALILYRLEGEPSVDGLDVMFPDVAKGDWYYNAAVWALANGVFIGFDDGSFRGDAIITREQLAAVFHRYMEKMGFDLSGADADLSKYIDEPQIGDWAVPALQWAVSAGLLVGRTETTIVPQGTTQRAELAMVLFRLNEKYNVIPEGTEIR